MPTLAIIIASARPSVVRIDTPAAMGSGVIFEVNPSARTALALTNYHVIEGHSQISVTVNDSVTCTGTVLGYDATRDLAVVTICCASDFRALPFGDAGSIPIGSDVIAIGHALGIPGSATVTRGIVSAVRYESDVDRWVIQTDAPINPGNSGGPLLSESGKVLGINTYIVRSTSSGVPVEGFGFAVSAVTVQQVLPTLKAGTAAPFPTPTPLPEAPGGVYTSQKYWYTIKVPSGWRFDSSNADAVVTWDPTSGATAWAVVKEIDPDAYPTLDSYVARWRPAPAEGWTDFQIVSQRRIRQDQPVPAYEWVYTYKKDATSMRVTSQWYVSGRFLFRVSAIADDAVWNFEMYRSIRTKLEEALASFEPSAYTSAQYGYSVAHPMEWKQFQREGYDYWAYNPTGPGRVYVQVAPAIGWPSIQAYGDAHTVKDSTVLSRRVVYTGRPNASYRIDYTWLDATTGRTYRGAVLITLITLGGGHAVWAFIDDYQENWSQLSSLVDDVFLRVAVIP